jgi:hypothetical protein
LVLVILISLKLNKERTEKVDNCDSFIFLIDALFNINFIKENNSKKKRKNNYFLLHFLKRKKAGDYLITSHCHLHG